MEGDGGTYTEIAGGSITEIVEDNYDIYAGRHIINTADKSVTESGANKGVKFGTPAKPPATEIKAKCIVQFRPNTTWTGEYGFDWIRLGDTALNGDNKYKDIVGKNRNAAGQVSENTNYGANLVPDIKEYNKLLQQYNLVKIAWKPDFYIVPWLALYKGKTATLSLVLETVESPKKLEFKYNEKLFQLNHKEIADKSKGKKTLSNYLTVKCIESFNVDQYIDVLADKELVGRLKVYKNGKTDRKKVNVVLACVKTNVGGIAKRGLVTGEAAKLQKHLGQALITPNTVVDNSVDLSTDAVFNQRFIVGGQISYNGHALHDYMLKNHDLKKKHPKSFIIYVFDLPASSGTMGVGGEAYDIPSDNALVFSIATRRKTALVHEFLHGLGLQHTFGNDSTFTYTKGKTENIMDYLDIRCAIWKWQWDIIRKNGLVTPE